MSQNRADRFACSCGTEWPFRLSDETFRGHYGGGDNPVQWKQLDGDFEGYANFTDRLSLSAGHSVIPAGVLEPGVQVLVGDCAYHRVSNEWKGHFYLPTKLPEDRSNPEVSKIFLLPRQLLTRRFRRPI